MKSTIVLIIVIFQQVSTSPLLLVIAEVALKEIPILLEDVEVKFL